MKLLSQRPEDHLQPEEHHPKILKTERIEINIIILLTKEEERQIDEKHSIQCKQRS